VTPDIVGEFLYARLGPALGPTQELSRMLLLKIIDGLFKLNLCCAKWMNLHKLLKVEEGLRDREFVTAT